MTSTIPLETKFCKYCLQTKSTTEFHWDRKGNRFLSECKVCSNERKKRQRVAYKQKNQNPSEQLILIDAPQLQRCNCCHQTKPIQEFPKNIARRDGYIKTCKKCTNLRQSGSERKHYDNRNQRLLHKYNITIEQYENMLAAQGNVCAICGRPETTIGTNGKTKPLSVDHDHVTGKVRGLLCIHCNRALGCLKDNPIYAENLLHYITLHTNE